MRRVADEFGESQSLIHYHFDSREGLLAALLERERELYIELFDGFPNDPEARLDRIVDVFVRDSDTRASSR